MTIPSDRMIRYDMLELREQLLLEFLSFVGRPLFKNEIVEQFSEYLKRFGLAVTRCDEMVSQLASSGYLERTGGKLELLKSIREEVSARSTEAGRAQLQCEVATSGKFPAANESNFVKTRRALYLGQTEKLANLLARERATTYFDPMEYARPFTEELLTGICSERPLRLYPEALATEVAVTGLVESMNRAIPARHFYSWLTEHRDPENEPLGHAMWLHQELLRERELPPDTGSFLAKALQKILRGDLSDLDRLQGHILREPASGVFSYMTEEFIYVAACYVRNQQNFVRERLENGSELLRPIHSWFFEVRSGARNSLDPSLLLQMNQRDYPPILMAVQYILIYWAGFENHLEPGRVFSLARRYEDAEYKALADPLFALYCRLVGEKGSPAPFLDLLKPSELWETTLTQLESWRLHTESSRGQASEERVAWVLSMRSGRPSITARIQKKNRSGRWSKGRVVALEDLRSQYTGSLSVRDHQVIESAVGMTTGFSSERYKVLEDLVDHPCLFSEDGQPIEMVRGVPRLVVHRAEEAFTLNVVPAAFERSRYALLSLSNNKYELVVYDENSEQLTRLLPSEGVEFPASEEERVRSILLVASQNGFSVESYFAVGEETEVIRHDGKLTVRLFPQGRGLRAEVGVEPFGLNQGFFLPGEGERYFSKRTERGVVEIARQLEREVAEFERFVGLATGFQDALAIFESPIECLEMLESLRRLPQDFVTVQWPQGRRFALNRALGMQDVRFSVRRESDWFAVQGELLLSSGEEMELSALIERSRGQEGRFIELDDGSYVALTQDLEKRIRAMESAVAKEADGRLLFSTLAGSVLFEDVEFFESDESWRKTQARLQQVRTIEPPLPQGFQGELREYQEEGYRWLMRSALWGVGVCLADDMGLGKTVQILACLLSRAQGGPALVVAPTSVCANWKEEAHRFTPELDVAVYGESDRESVLVGLSSRKLVICSYGLMCRDIEKIKEIDWHTVVLDESQAIKNTQTQRFKAAVELKADFRIAATGTPVENHLGELWALFRFLNPGLLGSQRLFQARYGKDETALESLRFLLSPFLLRRLKKDVLLQLPSKTEITLSVELSRAEKLFYESLRLRAVEKVESEGTGLIGILAELTKLRRACCHPTLAGGESSLGSSKLDGFLELLEGLLEGGHRALVFSQFVDHLGIVAAELKKRKVGFQYLDGSTPVKKRAEAVRAFQDGEGELFLISLKAGGTGLNLTAANYVIHLDPWWNPATEDQASDRAHRIGQEQPVTVYRLIGKNTIEEKILALHKEKRDMVDNLLQGSDKAGKLSADELLELLKDGHGLGESGTARLTAR